ncbi:MAG: RNA-binding S4 domain-containing protein [Flavobacteriales bacterium]
MEFQLKEQEYIELNVLLKLLNLVDSGGMAKMLILDNQVKVNNQVENRIRRKLRVGDVVAFQKTKVVIKS